MFFPSPHNVVHQFQVLICDISFVSFPHLEEINKEYHGARSNVMFTSLVQKTDTSFSADAALTINDERWIVFPWEKD